MTGSTDRFRSHRVSGPPPSGHHGADGDPASWSPEQTPYGRRFGPYLVTGVIGQGGFGAVYQARHIETGGDYALKVILPALAREADPDELERFRREAELLARVDAHPNIVRVYSCGEQDGALYTVMELVRGRTLDPKSDHDRMPPREAARVIAKVGRALHHAHAAGVVHRDLKPANLIIDEASGEPRVLDFGLALDPLARQRLTKTGEAVGTPAFMAPEQLREVADPDWKPGDEVELGPTIDVYGLGAVFYNLVGGQPPFLGDMIQVVTLVLSSPPRRLSLLAPGLDPELEAVCAKAMAKEAADRYPTAAAMADDLERWLRGEPVEARPTTGVHAVVARLVPTDPRRRRAGAILVGLVAAALVSAGVGTAFFSSRSRRIDAEIAKGQGVLDVERAIARALEGDPDGITAGLDAVAALSADEAATIRVQVEQLARLQRIVLEGDIVAVRAYQPEAGDPEVVGLVRLLIAVERPEVLTRILAQSIALADDPEVVHLIARAIAEDRVPASRDLIAKIVEELEAGAGRGGPPEGDAPDPEELLARLLLRAIEVEVTGDDIDRAWLDRLIGGLIPTVRHGRLELDLPDAVADRLFEIATADVEAIDWTGSAYAAENRLRTQRLFELAISALPPNDARADRAIGRLYQLVLIGLGVSEPRISLDVGALLFRIDSWPLWPNDLGDYVGDEAVAAEEAGRLAVEFVDARVPDAALLAAVSSLIDLRYDRIAAVRGQPIARHEALLSCWDEVEAIFARERIRGDLPGWMLAWLGHQLHRCVVSLVPDQESLALRARLEARVAESAGDLIEGSTSRPIHAAMDRIYERAAARNGGRHRSYFVPIFHADWVRLAAPREKRASIGIPLVEEACEILAARGAGFRELAMKLVIKLEDLVLHFGALQALDGSVTEADGRDRVTRLVESLATVMPATTVADELEALLAIGHRRFLKAIAILDRLRVERSGDRFLWRTFIPCAELALARMPPGDERERIVRQILEWSLDGDPRKSFGLVARRAPLWDAIGEPERAEADRASSEGR